VTSKTGFRKQLRDRLLAYRHDVLLRIVVGPNFREPIEFTGAEILSRAEQLAASNVSPAGGNVVLLLLPHCPELFLLHLGLVLQGDIPAILAWPTSRVDPEKYQRNLVHQLSNLPAGQLLTVNRLAENLACSLPYEVSSVETANAGMHEKLFPSGEIRELIQPLPAAPRTVPSRDTIFLQFSGGTTGAQKAVAVTGEMLATQLARLRDALNFNHKDSVASWLPMYHDMGLIACLWMPLWHGASSVHIGANDWVMKPTLLLEYISRFRSTFCWLPNFSFSYLSQQRAHFQDPLGLESVKAWINCSEPVRLKSMSGFANAFADCGVKSDCLQTSYAMAEAVFAITQSQLGAQPPTVRRTQLIDATSPYTDLAFDVVDNVYVSSGRPLQDTEVKIMQATGSECPDLVCGEIYIKTPSLFSGYWGSDGFQSHTLQSGWHATGDFGFKHHGEVFVIGRYKDIVIVGGQNIFPEDVEGVVNALDGVHRGRVVAFGVEDPEYGTQSLAVIAEASEFNEHIEKRLETEIRNVVLATIGIAPRYVAVLPRNWIVKSTAGKISRRETRERFLRERLTTTEQEVL
jgi:fatty-acyl-CoA synthase